MKFYFDSEYWIIWDYANTNSLHSRRVKTDPDSLTTSGDNSSIKPTDPIVVIPGDVNFPFPSRPDEGLLLKYRGKTFNELLDLVYMNNNIPISQFKSYVEFWNPAYNWEIFKDFTVEDKRKTMVDYIVSSHLSSIKSRIDKFKEDSDRFFPLIPYGFLADWVEGTVLGNIESITTESINSMDDEALNKIFRDCVDTIKAFLESDRVTRPGYNYRETNMNYETGDYIHSGDPVGEYVLLTTGDNVIGVDYNSSSIVKNDSNYSHRHINVDKVISEFNKFGKIQTLIDNYPSSTDKTLGIKGFFSHGDGDLRLSENGNGGFHVSIDVNDGEVDFSREYEVDALLDEDASISSGLKKVKVPVYMIPVDLTGSNGVVEIALSPKTRSEFIGSLKTGNIDDFPFFTFNVSGESIEDSTQVQGPTIPVSIKCLPFKKIFELSNSDNPPTWKFHTEVIYAFSPQG